MWSKGAVVHSFKKKNNKTPTTHHFANGTLTVLGKNQSSCVSFQLKKKENEKG